MMIAAAFFIASLIGLAFLFSLKSVEAKRGQTFAPGLRRTADSAALSLKAQLIWFWHELEKLPPALLLLFRYVLHEAALGLARIARAIETQLHNAADMISHKRHFEKHPGGPGEPRSEFLKHMQQGKQNGLAEEESEGQNTDTPR